MAEVQAPVAAMTETEAEVESQDPTEVKEGSPVEDTLMGIAPAPMGGQHWPGGVEDHSLRGEEQNAMIREAEAGIDAARSQELARNTMELVDKSLAGDVAKREWGQFIHEVFNKFSDEQQIAFCKSQLEESVAWVTKQCQDGKASGVFSVNKHKLMSVEHGRAPLKGLKGLAIAAYARFTHTKDNERILELEGKNKDSRARKRLDYAVSAFKTFEANRIETERIATRKAVDLSMGLPEGSEFEDLGVKAAEKGFEKPTSVRGVYQCVHATLANPKFVFKLANGKFLRGIDILDAGYIESRAVKDGEILTKWIEDEKNPFA
jgi:hypothetical protein